MSLAINAASLGSPPLTGLAALNAPKSNSAKDKTDERQAFDAFVGETFYSQMIKSMHKMHGKAAYFNGGHAEEAFQQQLDQTWAEQMSKANANTFSDSMYKQYMLSRQQ